MKKYRKAGIFLLFLCLLASCGRGAEEEGSDGLRVLTSFYPVYLIAQEVTAGTEGILLENMAQPQTGCLHDYELTIADMKELEKADILLVNGGGMEAFLGQALERYPHLQIVDTSAGIALLQEDYHHHGEAEAHEGAGNPHIWLLPGNAAAQAQAISDALGAARPEAQAVLERNTARFTQEMERLEREAANLPVAEGEKAAIFHEGFAYLAELFGLEAEIGIFAEEYQEPSAKELAAATDEMRGERITLLLAAADSGEKYARVLAAESGGQAVLLDPLTTQAAENDTYAGRMEQNILTMRQALEVAEE